MPSLIVADPGCAQRGRGGGFFRRLWCRNNYKEYGRVLIGIGASQARASGGVQYFGWPKEPSSGTRCIIFLTNILYLKKTGFVSRNPIHFIYIRFTISFAVVFGLLIQLVYFLADHILNAWNQRVNSRIFVYE